MSHNRRYFTTPIYYVNDVPHIGHAYTSVAVDFLARFSRLSGDETRFLTGTDEHGLKIQKAAEKLSISSLELCNKNSEIFRNLTKTLNLSNDDFIRTTEDRHKDGATYLWNLLFEKGDIYLDEYTGWYSVNDETFYNEKDLIKQNDGTFKTITGGPVEWIKEESYFFKLSKYQEKLLNYYNDNEDFILPESKRNEVINFVNSGLKDLSVSRTSFNWGIQVPNNSDHIMYVWLDALTCYPNSVNYLNNEQDELSSFWSNTTHIVGKDILRHHAVYWPAFLIAANLEWSGIKQNNRNPLLYKEMGADGLKTGHLSASGYGLAASAVQDGRRLISVTNGFSSSKKRSQGSARLLTWGFREFTNINIGQAGEIFSEIEIPLAKKMVQVTPSQNIKVTVSKANKDKIIQNIRVVPNISAPLPAGSVVATLEVVLSDNEKVNFDLETVNEVQKTGIIGRFFSFVINLITSLFSIIFS